MVYEWCTKLPREAHEAFISTPFSLLCVTPYCAPDGVKVVSEVRGLHVAGSFGLSESQWGGPTRNRSSSRPTTLCDERWYLDAVLGCDLHDPPHVWLVLEDGRSHLTAHRLLTYLLEQCIQPPGVWVTSILPTPSPTFLWACRVPLGM